MDELVTLQNPPSKVAEAHVDVSAVGAAGSRPSRLKRFLAAILPGRLLSLAVLAVVGAGALVVIGFAAAWIIPGLIDSAEQRALHRAPVHADHTALNTHVVRAFATPKMLIYRDRDGVLHRALVDETDLNRFVNDTLDYLQTERVKIKAETQLKVDALLATAFSDSQECIARYADWYFRWGQSYYFLKEGVVGGFKGIGFNNVQGFAEGARNEVEGYLIRNYERLVLKPELRNPIIEVGVAKIFAEAHQRYLETLTSVDDRLQGFLNQHTRHLDVIDPLQKPDLSIDWDAQKWKAPRYSTDDEAFRAMFQGVGDVAISALIAKTVGPAIERSIAQTFAAIASRIVVGLLPELYGAAAGSVVEPGAGTAAGWVIGAAGALVFDYVSNRQSERLGRAELERASNEALKATIGELSRALQRDLSQAVDVWFDDTQAIVAEQKPAVKRVPRS